MIKRYERRRVVETDRRIVDGTPTRVETLELSQNNGVINTAYIERLNATFRERLAPLARRCRALARQTLTLHEGMFLVGTVGTLTRVSTPPRRQRQPWRLGSPIIAGRCTNCCHCTYRRRVGHHPSNVGGPRICSNVLLSGGVGTISCGAIAYSLPDRNPTITCPCISRITSSCRNPLLKTTDSIDFVVHSFRPPMERR